jgi:hypothetical protein
MHEWPRKESLVTKHARSTGYRVRAQEVLAIARATMSSNQDQDLIEQDLIEKVTVLQEYLDLTTMYPTHNYGAVIRRASTELNAMIHGPSSEFIAEQRLLFAD